MPTNSNSPEINKTNAENNVKAYTGNVLAGLKRARDLKNEDESIRSVNVTDRQGNVLFTFRVRPLSESEYNTCRERATKRERNGREKFSITQSRSEQILMATVDEDKHIWTDPEVLNIFNTLKPTDVIDDVLFGGDKIAVINLIDELSGYGEDSQTLNIEEETKN